MNWLVYGLAILGGLLLLVLAVLWWKIWRPLRKSMRAAKQMMGVESFGDLTDSPEAELLADLPEPLEPIWATTEPCWGNEDTVRARVAEFEALGFQHLGVFSGYAGIIPMVLLLHPSGVSAMVGEDGEAEITRCKVLGFLDSGAPVIVSDRMGACPVVQLPGEVRIYRGAESAAELCRTFGEASAGQALAPLAADGLVERLEVLQMQRAFYLAANPEALEPWLKSTRAGDGVGLLDLSVRHALASGVTDCCRVQYARESGMSAMQWERMRDRLVFVHDRAMAADYEVELEEIESDIDGENSDISELLKSANAPMDRAIFAQRNATRPEHTRLRAIGRLQQPVETDVYLRP